MASGTEDAAAATMTEAVEDQKAKRARRVSFAEMTSVHFFDRDEYETNSTNSTNNSTNSNNNSSNSNNNSSISNNSTKASTESEDDDCGKEESEDGGREEEDEEDEEEVSLFFRAREVNSPGSNLGSATSNDEDNFFGPVSTSFIKPGRLLGSTTSDDNHDVTMDSTAFSMHFRSLARSESGEELKTPTAVNFSFGEKTPNQRTLGSSMLLTGEERPIFKTGLHIANLSGDSASSDMSLEEENSRKYKYDRLLSSVDDKFPEVEKKSTVNLLPGDSQSIVTSLDAENSLKYQSSGMLPVVDDILEEVDQNVQVNIFSGNTGGSRSPGTMNSNLVSKDRESIDMSLDVENSLKHDSSRQLPMVDDILVEVSKNVQVNMVSGNTGGSRSPGIMGSNIHLEDKGNDPLEFNHQQMQKTMAHVHNDILIDRVPENQMDDASGGFKASDVRHSTGLVAPCSLDPHPSSNISVDNAILSSNMDKAAVCSKKTDKFSALSRPTGHGWDTELIESNGNNQHEGEARLLELRFSPPKENQSVMGTSTPSKYSLLVTPPQNQNAGLPLGRNSSIQKSILKLEKLTSSISSHRNKKISDSYIHHVEPPEAALSFCTHSEKFLGRQESLSNNEKFCSPLRQEESQFIQPLALDGTLTRMIPSESTSKLSKDALQSIPGSASLATCRNLGDSRIQKNLFECFEKSPPKQYVHDVNVPGVDNQLEMDSFVSLFQLTDEFKDTSDRKRRNDYEIKSGDDRDEEILTMKSPKLQKIGCNDDVPGRPSEAYVGAYTSGHELKRWTDIYAKFSEDAQRLLPSAADNLFLRDIDTMDDVLASLQRSKSYRLLCDGILLQRTSAIINKDTKRIGKAQSLLKKLLYERAKSELMRLKRAKLQDKLQHLTSGLLDSQMLKSSLSPQHFPKVAPAGTVGNKDGKEVTCDRVTALLQHLEDSNNNISNSLKRLQLSCKIEVGQNCEDTLVLAKEHLMRRTNSRSIRVDIQMWDVHATESRNGHHTFILSYLDFVIQRLKVNAGPDSSIAIINKIDDTEISKKFPNMDALTAFKFALDNEYSRKYVGLRSLAQETQVTSSIMRSLLDVVEEVQQAQIEIKNLTWTSFCSQSAEQLGLRFCFLNFKTLRKLTLTLDISCLKRGIYPSDVSPSELAAAFDTKGNSSVEQIQLREIKNAVQNVRTGYMRILRLCRCISQAVQNQVQ